MQDFNDKKIVLGLCGGISVYKSAFLVRELIRLGAHVRVVMTQSAMEFVGPITFQALTGHPVHTELFDENEERGMGHIELARWADYFLVAPLSANTLARFAHGLADDLLSTLYLATNAPVILCPAMNRNMWEHPATQENVAILRKRGAMVVPPGEGEQACGEYGSGRLPLMETIINALRLYQVKGLLAGRSVLVSAGPTEEPIDPVRYISNRSSGKMGYAIAEAARFAGAKVTLISGPTSLTPPDGVRVISTKTANDMREAILESLEPLGILIQAAAVADYTPEVAASYKIKKDKTPVSLSLKPAPDILKEVTHLGLPQFVVGFCAETNDLMTNAKKKLREKKLDMIVANQVGEGLGFGCDAEEAFVLTKNEEIALPFAHKARLAGDIIAIIARNLQNNPHFQATFTSLTQKGRTHDS